MFQIKAYTRNKKLVGISGRNKPLVINTDDLMTGLRYGNPVQIQPAIDHYEIWLADQLVATIYVVR